MKNFTDIELGYNDAENYRGNRELKRMFNDVFVKDEKLDRLMRSDTYFVIGDKGTGKTAYAIFLENQEYMNTSSNVIALNDMDYAAFLTMKKDENLELSDLKTVWKIIILMMISSFVDKKDVSNFPIGPAVEFFNLQANIEKYYGDAFKPEVINTFRYIKTSTNEMNAAISAQPINIGGKRSIGYTNEQNLNTYQNNLILLARRFETAFLKLKLLKNKFLFIDNIDSRPERVNVEDYFSCLRSLFEAVWELNTGLFKNIRDSKGFFKIVLLIRPDILAKINLHNQASKIRDNSIYLDWRTTPEKYRTSPLYKLCERLLTYDNDIPEKDVWDIYFPWSKEKRNGEDTPSFISILNNSFSRPRDIISIMKAIQSSSKRANSHFATTYDDFRSYGCQNEISSYYIDEARDWCLYLMTSEQFETLLFFFQFLKGNANFGYKYYLKCYGEFINQVEARKLRFVNAIDNADDFLQLLYELNFICYYEPGDDGSRLTRYYYRERELHNLSPKVKYETKYSVPDFMLKALNLGRKREFMEG